MLCFTIDGNEDDKASYTLKVRSRNAQRRTLATAIGRDLALPSKNLPSLLILTSQNSCNAVAFFCKEVISQKEAGAGT